MAFCPACGSAIEPDAAFCPVCGRSLSRAVPVAAVPAATTAAVGRSHLRRNALVLIIAVVVIAAALLVLGGGVLRTSHTQVVAGGYAVIPEGYFSSRNFSIPAGASNAVVSGSFQASGDFNNQITVLIMSQADFLVWQQGTQVQTYYDSGQVTGASVSVPLPAGNQYVVVFDDTFTGAASTAITGQLTLSYTT
ncbi:MAG: zinc ribbon domain-containing protein [Thaumarchaeota archaeon]|nr:zinc ribbon domain-containing protein [Nitrososphaerota archaeon]